MAKPIIGITCFATRTPPDTSMGVSVRSAVNQTYIDAVSAAGGAPVCLPLGLDAESLRAIYRALDGVLLPGGDDVAPHRYGQEPHANLGLVDDLRDELELMVAGWALEDGLPILGICRGIQVLAVAAGGTLYQDLPSQLQSAVGHNVRDFGRDYRCHDMSVDPGSRLAVALGGTHFDVNSFHHQAVLDVPPGFVASARSCDGVVEAIESQSQTFAVGVQCHPEGMWQTTAPEFAGLFRAFVDAASRRLTSLAS